MPLDQDKPIRRDEYFQSGTVEVLDVLYRLLYQGVEVVPGGSIPAVSPATNGQWLTNNGTIAQWADLIEVPSVSGHSGKYLYTDGSTVSWQPSTGGSGLAYQGTWNASTNTPTIPAAAPANNGFYYRVSVAGTTLIDGESDWGVGDWIISNGTAWQKIDNTDKVTSVAGKIGDVVLYKADITDFAHTHLIADVTGLQTALDGKQATITGAATSIVSSNLTASRVLVSDGSGKVAISVATATEASYLSGVTGGIQGQIDTKEPSLGTGTTGQYLRGDKTWQTLDKSAVGLGNVINSLQLVASNNLSDLTNATTARTNLGLGSLATLSSVNNTNWSGTQLSTGNGGTGLTTIGSALQLLGVNAGGTALQYHTVDKAFVGLSNVENTALSTWAGSSNITTLGTVTTGTWHGTIVGLNYGGTGANLSAPAADRLLFYDLSAGAVAWLTPGTGLVITGTTISVDVSGYAPTNSTYVVVSTDATLTNERALVGTAGNISLSDGGAGGNLQIDIGTNVVTLTGSQSLTNKTLGSGTAITAATMSLGSDATGDIYYRNGSGFLTRLGVGTNGDILKLVAGLPSWQPDAGGIAATGTQATGQVAFWTSTADTLSRGVSQFVWDDTNKRLGIGINTPVSQLHISDSGTAAVRARFTNSNTGATATDGFYIGIDTTGNGSVWNMENLPIIFGTNNADRGRFTADGSFTIGVDTAPSMFNVGTTNQFQVSSSGDVVKLKNVTYSWPSSQGSADTVLKNNGSGTLSWGTLALGNLSNVVLTTPSTGEVLQYNGTNWVNASAGAGSVTSVALSAPSEFSVSGSPVTNNGTLGLSWANQTQNRVLASPDGLTGTPAFRALVSNDIPSLDASKIGSGILSTVRGGTGVNASGATDGQILIGNGTGLTLATITQGTGITVTNGAGTITIAAVNNGTVTSVALSAPTEFSVSGSPVTTNGTLGLSWASQTANRFFAAPDGSTGTPTFRAIAHADLAASGGTGTKYLRDDMTWQTVTGGSNEIADNLFRVIDNTDNTKKLAFEVSGVTTATTRTATVPNRDFTLDQINKGTTTIISADAGGILHNSVAGGIVTTSADYVITAAGMALGKRLTLAGTDSSYQLYCSNSNTGAPSSVFQLEGARTNNTTHTVVEYRGLHASGPSNGFGLKHYWRMYASTNVVRDAGWQSLAWVDATDATRTSEWIFEVVNSATPYKALSIRRDEIRIGTTSNYVGLAVSSPTSYTITLPSSAPGSNTYLKYNGSSYEWATVTGGSNEIADNLFRVIDNTDNTKKLAFEVSGVTTATTRTATVPNRDFTLDQINEGTTTIVNADAGGVLYNNAGVLSTTPNLTWDSPSSDFGVLGTMSIGNSSGLTAMGISATGFTGADNIIALNSLMSSSNTTGKNTLWYIDTRSTGVPTAGFGATVFSANLETSTLVGQFAASLGVTWTDATHATRTSQVEFDVVQSGTSRRALEIRPDALRIGTASNYVGLAVSSPTSYTITLPSAAPGSNTWLKYNGTAYEWATLPAASGSIAESLIDAKGDLIAGTANDTAGRLAVGTNGYTLQAASGEATGLKWSVGDNFICKTADETIASNATLQNDDHLAWTAPATGTYLVEVFFLVTTANATMDYKYDMTFSGTATVQGHRRHTAAGAAAGTDNENNVPLTALPGSTAVTATTSGTGMVWLWLVLDVTVTGTLNFRWAQNTSDAGNLVGKKGSYLRWHHIA